MTTTDCTTAYGEYERYSDDKLFHGAGLKIDRSIYYKGDCDISDLITKSAKEVENLRDESIGKENAAYEKGVTGSCGMGKVGACYQKT